MSTDIYRPTEEHEAFRAAVREVCDAKVAPRAAETDELAEFPKASYDALVAADLQAPHIAEEYGGVGADALATVIVIEEVARTCASTSLIPSVNKLASLAWPEPAMSRAVPWSGEVRTNGKPSVTLTPPSKSSAFSGISAWSWYMQIAAS